MRIDYKVERNKQIFADYINSDTSFNKLAQKYGVSPQRVRYVVNDYKNRNLGIGLDIKSSKEEREAYKNKAVEVRESGHADIALGMFDDVIKWDEEHLNMRGKIDVLGHKKICLTHLADNSDETEKNTYLEDATQCLVEAIDLIEKTLDIPAGNIGIQKVHLASLLYDKAMVEKTSRSKKYSMLKDGLEKIEEALQILPGSKAHKAWPMLTKARILYALEKVDDALKALREGQQYLFEGYEEELGNAQNRTKKERDKSLSNLGNDQAQLKLRVWNSGLMLGFAEIYFKEGKFILAEVYASAVYNTPDPDGTLKLRKSQAKKILDALK